MDLIQQAFAWLIAPTSWIGDSGIARRLSEHLVFTVVVVGVAATIALPVGVVIGHTRRGTTLVSAATGAARAMPTLGLLTLLGLGLGIGLVAPAIALIVLASPSLLAGAYAGVQSVDRQTVDAARAMGMSEPAIIRTVELPLAAPLILGGLRSATLQVVATATLAAYTSNTGLGRYIFAGLKGREYAELIGGSALIVALALLLDGIFALVQRVTLRDPHRLPVTTERHHP